MDRHAVEDVIQKIIEHGLEGLDEGRLVSEFCRDLRHHGIDVEQAAVFLDTLHPVLESQGFYWDASSPPEAEQKQYLRPDSDNNAQLWRGSPFQFMEDRGLTELHIPLAESHSYDFAILDDLRQAGHTDYFVQIHPLGGSAAIGAMDSLYSRWSTKHPDGFYRDSLDLLRKAVPALALGIKAAALRRVAGGVASVYLGRDAGRRVLEGRIERGSVESIHTVIWFSDMRNYTSLSERTHSSDLIGMLNDYAEAAIQSIHAAGGDVLKLIGDGVLAIFNRLDPREAAIASVRAWRDLDRRISVLNARRRSDGLSTTTVCVGIHTGEVFYGNIGSEERLDFTVVGPAVNEASRIVAACRTAKRSLLISAELLELLPNTIGNDFDDLGEFRLKGVQQMKRLYAHRSGSLVAGDDN